MEHLSRWKQFLLVAVLLGVGLLFFIGYGREAAIPLRVAVLPGVQQQILQVAKQEAAKNGIHVEIVVCQDYMEPNSLLADGRVDANIYQPKEFLQSQSKDCGYDFQVLGQATFQPQGLYSRKIRHLSELPLRAVVLLPRDAIAGPRALKLMESAGLLTLKPGLAPSVTGILENPLALQLIEIDELQMNKQGADADLMIMGTSCAVEAEFVPRQDALFLEGADSPFTTVIAVRIADLRQQKLQQFLRAYCSPPVKRFVEQEMNGAVFAAW